MTSTSSAGHSRRLLVLTGPPGAGKTTVARLIAASLPTAAACVETDWFWTTIANGHLDPWLPEADAQNRTMIRAAATAAATLQGGGYHTVIEGIIGPWMLDELTSAIGLGQPVDYVVLRPELATCLERAADRPATARTSGLPPLQDPVPIRQLWEQFADLGSHEQHAIDTTDIDAERAVAILQMELPTGRFRLG